MTGAVIAVYAVVVLLMIASMWRVFSKAGEAGWKCLIPILNTIVILRIAGKPAWWIVLFFVPFANIVFAIMALNGLAKSFGKGGGFTAGLILLPFIFYPVLGFGGAKYVGPGGSAPAGAPAAAWS